MFLGVNVHLTKKVWKIRRKIVFAESKDMLLLIDLWTDKNKTKNLGYDDRSVYKDVRRAHKSLNQKADQSAAFHTFFTSV